MTRNAWNPPSNEREIGRLMPRADSLERRVIESGGGGFPIVFRAAIKSIADPEADRVHYPSGQGGDNVYWDVWDTTFDTSVYDIDPYLQTNDPDEGEVIAGVQLKKLGLYSIKAQIDVDDAFNGITLFGSNYDEGQAVYAEHNNIGRLTEPFLGDFYGIRLDHWRQVTVLPDEEENIGTEEWSVEIVFAQQNDSTVVPYGGVAAGKFDGFGNPPLPGQDLWIPGGYDGGYGLVPHLVVMYWGEPDWDPDWPGSFPLTQ